MAESRLSSAVRNPGAPSSSFRNESSRSSDSADLNPMKISALLLFVSFFQTTRPALAPFTIQGRVIDAETQQPMVRATVQVTSSHGDAILARDTGADGSFTFSNVPAGDYSIEASAAGYIPNSYGERRGPSAAVIEQLGGGKSLTGIQIALTRGGVI